MPRFVFVLILLALLIAPPTPAQSTLQPLGIALDSYLYPYPVHFLPFHIEGQDLLMGYMDVPAKGTANGRSVVLMHGKNFGGYYWASVAALLSNAGYRVVIPDQIGWAK